jgi:hypothetical protein
LSRRFRQRGDCVVRLRDRLLDQDMFVSGEARQGIVRVRMIGAEHEARFDLGRRQQRVATLKGATVQAARQRVGPGLERIVYADETRRRPAFDRLGVKLADNSGAKDSDAKRHAFASRPRQRAALAPNALSVPGRSRRGRVWRPS